MKNNRTLENRIYAMIWFLGFALPFLLSTGGFRIDWMRVIREELRILPFFLLFLINNFLVFQFFRQKKYLIYFTLISSVILILGIFSTFDYLLFDKLVIFPEPPGRRDGMFLLNTFFYNAVFAFLVVGMNNSVKLTFQWLEEKRSAEQLQKENLSNQLALLKQQISPHFLMNTLNNIHALIDQDREIAKSSVVKLSKLMRVLLYEHEEYSLNKEIGFLNDYIELARIRVSEQVEILFQYPDSVPKVKIPPLLFISLVENAFKHGIRAFGKSFIHLHFSVDDRFLYVTLENSKGQVIPAIPQKAKIGLENTRKRLDLMYGKSYTFEVRETDSKFSIHITIPIHEDPMPGR